MRGDAERVTLGKFTLAPAGFFGDQLDHFAQPRCIDRIRLYGTHVGIVDALRLQVYQTGRSHQLKQIVFRIAARRLGELVGEGANGESVVDIGDGAQPPDADVV